MSQIQFLSIEDTLTELEALVDTLEQGDLSLDDPLRRFDRSSLVAARACYDNFAPAEQQTEITDTEITDVDLPLDSNQLLANIDD